MTNIGFSTRLLLVGASAYAFAALATNDARAADGGVGTPGADAPATTTLSADGASSTGTVVGGNGGASGTGGDATGGTGSGGVGGSGGAGGAAVSSTVNAGGTVSVTGTVTGGDGSPGGLGGNGGGVADHGGNGGVGGSGGAGVLTLGSGVTNVAGTVTGGNASFGGPAGAPPVAVGGSAGAGGAGISIRGTGTLNVGGVATTVTGGTGVPANGGATAGTSGFGIDASGAGAGAVINLTGATIAPGADGGGIAQSVAVIANGGTTINFSGVNTLNGGLTSTGTVNLGTVNTTTVTGPLTLSGATLKNTIQATQATSGQIIGNTAATNTLLNAVVQPTVTGVGLANGEKIVLIKNSAGTAATLTNAHAQTAAGAFATDTTTNTLVRGWSVGDGSAAGFGGTDKFGAAIGAHDVVLEATINSAATITGDRSIGQSAAFDAAANYTDNGTNSSLVILNQAVQNLNTVDGVRKAADQLRPEASGATSQAAWNAMNGLTDATEARMQSLRFAARDGSGHATDEAVRGLGLWAQGFGGTASQDSRDNFTGYDVQTYGLAAGGDVRVAKDLRVGIAFAYAKGNVDENDNRSGDTLDVDSSLATLYASYTGAPVYVDLSVNAGHHSYDSTRVVTMPNFGAGADANFDGTQYGAKAEVGYPIDIAGKAVVSPLVSLAYAHLGVDGYTETGATGANLSVDGRNVDSIRSGLGARVDATLFKSTDWEVKPSLKAVWTHEFNTDPLDTTDRFAAGGNSFVTAGIKPEADAVVLGGSVDLISSSHITGSLAYNAEVEDGYVGQFGMVQIRYDF